MAARKIEVIDTTTNQIYKVAPDSRLKISWKEGKKRRQHTINLAEISDPKARLSGIILDKGSLTLLYKPPKNTKKKKTTKK